MARNVTAVSLVVTDKCSRPQSLLYVHKRRQPWRPTRNFTLCPGPLNSNFSSVAQLLQFVEVNGVFGADHFIFYNYSSSEVLNPYFRYYISSGKAKVIQWKLPVSVSDVHYFAQVVSLNDCVLRAMLTSRYVASLDLDEVLLPLTAPDWWSLIQEQNGSDNSSAGYRFANTFFVPDKTNPRFENHVLMKQYPIAALLHTTRDNYSLPYDLRGKFLVQPEHTRNAHIHVPKSNSGYKIKGIPVTEGILAHYRSRFAGERHGDVSLTRMHDFSEEILRRVAAITHRIRSVDDVNSTT